MFNNNLQAIQPINPHRVNPANVKTKPVNFQGASFEPIRPEHLRIKVDDTVVYKETPDSKQNEGFFARIYRQFIEMLARNSQEFIEIEQESGLPFEYKISYYA